MDTVARLMPGSRTLWLTFYAAILAAWAVLFAMQAGGLRDAAGWQLAGQVGGLPFGQPLEAFLSLCSATAANAGFKAAILMWALMALAMMAPTAFPAFRTYAQLTQTATAGNLPLVALVSGYLAVWLGFSGLAGALQVWLAAQALLDPFGKSVSNSLNAALLLLAGAYQFSRLKQACLSSCRNPLTFFFSHWQPGARGALSLGLRLGAVCLGCCWALMLLAFVAGTMNLAFMGLAMVLMTLEKLPDIGAKLTAPLGVFLILAGLVVLVLPLLPITI